MQGEPGVDYNDSNLNPLVCDLCNIKFKSLDELGEHQKEKHNMQVLLLHNFMPLYNNKVL